MNKLEELIELSKKYEIIEVSCYNYWRNPYGFKNIGSKVSKIEKIPNQYHLHNFKALGGSGTTEWNHNFVTGTSIAVMYYKISTGAIIDLNSPSYIRKVDNTKLELITDVEINLIKELAFEANDKRMLEYEETKEYKLQQQLNNN
jgi:arabinogalactan endo-1,4-beta-galactosidase